MFDPASGKMTTGGLLDGFATAALGGAVALLTLLTCPPMALVAENNKLAKQVYTPLFFTVGIVIGGDLCSQLINRT